MTRADSEVRVCTLKVTTSLGGEVECGGLGKVGRIAWGSLDLFVTTNSRLFQSLFMRLTFFNFVVIGSLPFIIFEILVSRLPSFSFKLVCSNYFILVSFEVTSFICF